MNTVPFQYSRFGHSHETWLGVKKSYSQSDQHRPTDNDSSTEIKYIRAVSECRTRFHLTSINVSRSCMPEAICVMDVRLKLCIENYTPRSTQKTNIQGVQKKALQQCSEKNRFQETVTCKFSVSPNWCSYYIHQDLFRTIGLAIRRRTPCSYVDLRWFFPP